MPGIADKFTQSAQGRLLRPGMTTLGRGISDHTATNSATPNTISAMPESSRPDSDCLNE
jgi:hypothetical protein